MKERLIRGLEIGDKNYIQFITKLIASSIRDEMEDFHIEHLTDKQMKELNPLIRKGIYSMLYSLSKCDRDELALHTVQWRAKAIPSYWEDVELEFGQDLPQMRIKSPFLLEQIEKGNIKVNHELRAIELIPSYEMITDSNVKNLRTKIRNHLNKENFIYNISADLYFLKNS